MGIHFKKIITVITGALFFGGCSAETGSPLTADESVASAKSEIAVVQCGRTNVVPDKTFTNTEFTAYTNGNYNNPNCFKAWVADVKQVPAQLTTINGGVSFTANTVDTVPYSCDQIEIATILYEMVGGVATHIKTQTAPGKHFPNGSCWATLLVNGLQAGHSYRIAATAREPSGNTLAMVAKSETGYFTAGSDQRFSTVQQDDPHDFTGMSAQNLEDAYSMGGLRWGNYPFTRRTLVRLATAEAPNDLGLCGSAARSAYSAAAGSNWCSEFARSMFVRSGMRNIRYCETFIGFCIDYTYLTEVSTFEDFTDLFTTNGAWIRRTVVSSWTPSPGDYMNIGNHHSGVVVGVSDDKAHIWSVEGNIGDCVRFMDRPFYTGNSLNPDIVGFGDVSVAF